jgi:hypothetical protein
MKINKDWHLANRMPKNPNHGQRMLWHIDHAKNCTCRLPSEKLKAQMKEFMKADKTQNS